MQTMTNAIINCYEKFSAQVIDIIKIEVYYLTNNKWVCIIKKKILGDFCLFKLIVIEKIAK